MNARISGNTRSISLRKRLSSCKTVTEKPKAELLHDRLEFPTFLLTFYTCYDKMFAKETGTARF